MSSFVTQGFMPISDVSCLVTDVAGEMEIVAYQQPVQNCTVCRKACIAAVEMLRVSVNSVNIL